MSSWKKDKIQKVHRERPQPEARAHLGMLERKKDYRERAKDFHRKEDTLKKLRRKAEDRNPDEFYFNMTRTKKVDGDHQRRETSEPVVTEDQEKMMATQDCRYVLYRLSKELKKIEKLKRSLHMIDSSEKKNQHTVFVDTEAEAKDFDAAKFFDTHPAFIDRTFNRPRMEQLRSKTFSLDDSQSQAAIDGYNELSKRIDRAKELKIIAEKLEAKVNLGDKKNKKKLVKEETKECAAQYKFTYRRKK